MPKTRKRFDAETEIRKYFLSAVKKVTGLIPLMKEEEHYKNEVVKLGRFNGGETLKFVELILERYGQYCQTVKK